jgi:phosphonopyruvate decarboxylase
MLKPEEFFKVMVEKGISFFAGVPDSLLKQLCACITDKSEKHYICANEGNAVGMAIGHHLATGEIPCIYMQNSGIGNAYNPLISLADPEVYSIPMLFIIGWRGEAGTNDEPQHKKQGRIMLPSFGASEIDYDMLPTNMDRAYGVLATTIQKIKDEKKPYCLIVKKGTFEAYELQSKVENNYSLTRESVITSFMDACPDAKFIATTGHIGRELYENRDLKLQGHENDFLSIGGMGHSSSIALGVAINTQKDVICLDGDGSVLMHMGSLAINGQNAAENFKHIILNNGAHHSVGGQPTHGHQIDFCKIAKSCGYKETMLIENEEQLKKGLKLLTKKGPVLLDIRVNMDFRKELVRPSLTPKEMKDLFMDRFKD